MGYLYAQGTKIESGPMPVLNNTDISFSLRVKGWIFQQQLLSSGDRRGIISAIDSAVTRTAWIVGLLTQSADSAVTSVPQVKRAHHQYRHAKPSTGAKSAQALSGTWDPLVGYDADKWYVMHWGGEGNTSGDKMWLKVLDEEAGTYVIDVSTTLSSTGELQTPTGDHKLVINPAPADDVGTTFGLTDAQIGHYEIDGLAIYQPHVEYTVAADLSENPVEAAHANLEHAWFFDEASGTTVPDQVGSEDLTISTASGGGYWAPKMGPSWDFDGNQLPADSEYVRPDNTGTQTPGTGSSASVATPAIQNGRMEGHRNGTNPDNNMRVQSTSGIWNAAQISVFKTTMGTNLMPAGFFATARAFAGPSLALRKNGAINDAYVNIGVSWDNGLSAIELGSVFKSDSGDSATGDGFVVTDPIGDGPIRTMFVVEPDGSDWRVTGYAKLASMTWWRETFSKGGYPTDSLAAVMIRLTTQNGAGGNNLAHGSGEMQYYDDVNVDGGVWNNGTVQVTAGRTVNAERVGRTTSQHSVTAERIGVARQQRAVAGEHIEASNAMTWTINAERLASIVSGAQAAGERTGFAQAGTQVSGERIGSVEAAETLFAESVIGVRAFEQVFGERLAAASSGGVVSARTVYSERLASVVATHEIDAEHLLMLRVGRTVYGEHEEAAALPIIPVSGATVFAFGL